MKLSPLGSAYRTKRGISNGIGRRGKEGGKRNKVFEKTKRGENKEERESRVKTREQTKSAREHEVRKITTEPRPAFPFQKINFFMAEERMEREEKGQKVKGKRERGSTEKRIKDCVLEDRTTSQ